MRDLYISWEDLKKVFEKKRRKIVQMGVFGAVLFFIYFILKPPLYEASATFKQASSRSEQGADFKNFIRSFSSYSSEEMPTHVILSRAVLTKTMSELGLQGRIKNESRFKTLWNNLLTEFGQKPLEPCRSIFKNISYSGEMPRHFFIRFLTPETFEILDGKELCSGRIGEELCYDDITFTLVKIPSLKLQKNYPLTFLPRRSVIEKLKSKTVIKRLPEDKNILVLKFFDTDRHLSSAFINTLMSKYEEYLIEENKAVIGAQLKYLEKRQDELGAKLDIDMKEHVALMKENFMKHGFLGIQNEIESLLQPLQSYRGRVDNIDVELVGLEKRMLEKTAIPVEDKPKLVEQFGRSLAHQIHNLKSILQQLESQQEVSPALFAQIEQVWESPSEVEKPIKKEQVSSHLQILIENLALRQKNLEESCTYIEKLETDFRGMTLEASRRLFGEYCQQLDNLQAQLKQVIFFRDHLHKPEFEISTLSNLLTDSVTEFLVQKAGKLEAELCDSINRSSKEHHRLKEALIIQKRFLESHLSQVLELGKIRIQLFQEKIGSLYKVMKELLLKEKEVLEYKITQLKNTLQEVPELWHLDKRLQFKADLTQGMMEGLTNITETKNLSRHLYQVESKPLDLSEPPLSPVSPFILLKTAGIGAFLSLISYLFFVIKAFLKGLPASLSTIRMMGGHCSGDFSNPVEPFTELSEQDLQTLRNISSFLLEKKKSTVAFLSERDSSFCFNLARLLQFHHQKIAIIDCNLDRISVDQQGLWQFLNNEIQEIPFIHENNYDFLPAGQMTRYAAECLSSDRFKKLLKDCQSRYDFVFLLRQVSLNSQDAKQMLYVSDLAVITTWNESQEILHPYIQLSRQKENFYATFAEYV